MFKYIILSLILIGILTLVSKYIRLNNYSNKLVISDHFNGKNFHNNEHNQNSDQVKKINIINFLKWRISDNSEKNWPKNVSYPRKKIPELTDENEVIITFINHSTILIQTQYGNIITDPVFSKKVGPYGLVGPKRRHNKIVEFDDLPKIDYVLVSHDHYDHMDLDSLNMIKHRDKAKIIGGLGLSVYDEGLKINELDWWETKIINRNLKIYFVPAKHWSGRYGFFSTNKTLWGGFLIEINNKIIYFAGDTAFSKVFAEIAGKFPGKVTLSFLPIGAYEPKFIMQSSHINPEEAVKAHLLLGSKKSIAIHYGSFKLSSEGYYQPISDLEKALKKYSLNPTDFEALQPGESFKLFLD